MSAFRQELQACLPDLWRYACALCRNRDTADDLVQDCAERALRKQALWAGEGPLKPWLMKMLLNLYRNQLRAGASRPHTLAIDDMTGEPAAADQLDDTLALSETAAALAALTDTQREALLTVVIGALSYKDAAQALEIPIGTLMSRLGRARAGLRAATGKTERRGTR